MRSYLLGAAVLLLALVGLATGAGAFTFENEAGDVSGATPRLTEPGRRDERTTDPSGASSLFLGGRRDRSDRYDYDRYNGDPTFEPRPLPRGAQIGGGDHGFDNFRRYQTR